MFALFVCLLTAGDCRAYDAKVGDPAPALEVGELLQAPPEQRLDRESLEGKVVIVDFWATWCSPCIESMPHVNTLSEKFKSDPVVFLAITPESENDIRDFLVRHPFRVWIGVNGRRAVEAFNGTYPSTILIGKDGRIAARTQPHLVTEKAIRRMLDGRSPGIRPDLSNGDPAEAASQMSVSPRASDLHSLGYDALHAVVFRELDEKENVSRTSLGKHRFVHTGSLLVGISRLYNVPILQIEGKNLLPDKNYAVLINSSVDPPRNVLADLLKDYLGLNIELDEQDTDVFVLNSTSEAAGKLEPPEEEWRSGGGLHIGEEGVVTGLYVANGSLAEFTRFLEQALQVRVLDETGMDGRYDLDLSWNEDDKEHLPIIIERKFGLTLSVKRRKLSRVVLSKADGQ